MTKKKPAQARAIIPPHVLKNARELSAMGDAAKAAAKAKRAGKLVKAKRMKLGDMSKPSQGVVDSFVIPADAASVERMAAQVHEAFQKWVVDPHAESSPSRYMLAALGIKA